MHSQNLIFASEVRVSSLNDKVRVLLIGLLGAVTVLSAASGSFRGKVVESDQTVLDPDWLYVQGRDHAIRRVEVSHARVEYDEAVPAADRKSKAEQSLVAGTEVRITAEQGKDGEWRASVVEILAVSDQTPSDHSTKAEMLFIRARNPTCFPSFIGYLFNADSFTPVSHTLTCNSARFHHRCLSLLSTRCRNRTGENTHAG